MSKKSIFIALGVLIVVVLIAVFKGKKENEVRVFTEKVVKGRIIETVAATGSVQPETEVAISPDVAGEIIELHVKDGDSVTKGDLLLKINPELVKSTLDQMRASLSGSKAGLASAQAQLARSKGNYSIASSLFKRNEQLFKEGVISKQEYENAVSAFTNSQADLEVAKKNVESAKYNVQGSEAVLRQANENVHRTSMYAPMSGIISALNSELGERVVGTAQMAGTEMMKIADLNKMEVKVSVSENDIVRVSLYDSVDIELDAFKNRVFKGVVTEIANSATATLGATAGNQATNFEVKIKILRSSYQDLIKDNPHPIRSGMSASVEIITETSDGIDVIAISSITDRKPSELFVNDKKYQKKKGEDKNIALDAGNKKMVNQHVFKLNNDNTVSAIKVETGIQNSEKIHILKGVKEGDEIVTLSFIAVNQQLIDGSKVKIVPKDQLFDIQKK